MGIYVSNFELGHRLELNRTGAHVTYNFLLNAMAKTFADYSMMIAGDQVTGMLVM